MSGASDPDPSSEKSPSLLKRLAHLLRGDDAAAQMRESLEEVIEESERQSPDLSAPERTMLANLLKFGELRVKDVMVPRADIVAVEEKTTLTELVELFREAQHSRLPVYRESLDDPIGLVHLKSVLELFESNGEDSFRLRERPIAQIKRDILFAPPSMPVVDLLLKMQTSHTHLALVIDEYGGTDGLVSIEDIIEEIVGDIADEHDEEAPHARPQPGGGFLADARIDLEDFRAETGIEFPLDEETEGEIDTLGGLVVSLLGRVPQRGEIVAHPNGAEFEVLEADPRRVKRLRIRPPANPAQA
ncbi:CBS domain containing-hemolysin-like protein [Rhizomicrobium palustre]|uniref:CBS domain containing-hemolysin-like protein n=1 Tax=Rhizomicrobium palustre TaxID=189966 RepID=A0A846MYL1_9PROT|nr:hemolysin family protein [Rhizomicrobium palustre]NIK88122.1 CBS domain containing-hemolysin-like protein [Rhizomicrobium palustre]